MNLEQLKGKGGIVDGSLVKKEVKWTRPDPKTGKPTTDKFTIHVRRQSFGVVDRLYQPGEGEKNRTAKFIAASVFLGEEGEEAISYEDAFCLEPTLGYAFLVAVNEVNGLGKSGAKN